MPEMQPRAISPGDEPFTRTPEIDEGTFMRIKSLQPLDDVTIPLIRTLITDIEYTRKISPWYQGKHARAPRELLSTLIDPANVLGKLYGDLSRIAKNFMPGALPGHSDKMRATIFLSVMLLQELNQALPLGVITDAIKRASSFFVSLYDPANCTLVQHDYCQRIDSRFSQFVEGLTNVAEAFRKWERFKDLTVAFSKMPEDPFTQLDLKEVIASTEKTREKLDTIIAVEETIAETTRRIDRRTANSQKQKRITVKARQEKCLSCWDKAQSNQPLRESLNGKLTYEAAYAWYKSELIAVGVKSVDRFKADIKNRQKNASKERVKGE